MRYTPSGQPVANFSIAVDESFKNKDGQKVEKTEWVRIVVWGKQAEFVGKYLSKGRLVYIEGKLETRKYEKDGQDHYSTQIVASEFMFLDSKKDGTQVAAQDRSPRVPEAPEAATDDLPF
jgi:single-strand DNA-binding protein